MSTNQTPLSDELVNIDWSTLHSRDRRMMLLILKQYKRWLDKVGKNVGQSEYVHLEDFTKEINEGMSR